jgi:hypothetical protein
MYQWSKNIPNVHKIYQHFTIQGPPKFTQNDIFGLKINHLATLVHAPVGEHGELVDDGRVEEADVALAVADVLVRTGTLAAGALALGVQVVVLGEPLA